MVRCCVRCGIITVLLLLVLVFILRSAWLAEKLRPAPPKLVPKWWGPEAGANPKDNPAIKRYQIKIPPAVISDLHQRLSARRRFSSLSQTNFGYGVSADYMNHVVDHWLKRYNWTVWEQKLNRFDQFTTQIHGLDVHFLHVKPQPREGEKVFPLLILHGWPGSFFEFHKLIPFLTGNRVGQGPRFEVVAPSIPGYGFSQTPQYPGLNPARIAQMMIELMLRLNYTEGFYVQGGDWGSLIGRQVSRLRPDLVRGLHLNMAVSPFNDLRYWVNLVLAHLLPQSINLLNAEDLARVYPFTKFLALMWDHMGYFHLQSTRPDTVAFALTDSPVGLAAYVLEKFAAWTVSREEHKALPDGGLVSKFTLDEVLTNVMIYWVTGTISSSMRLYKESWAEENRLLECQPITVPTGVANFPNELASMPEEWLRYSLLNLIHYADMPRGGHFAALEEPLLLADDVAAFARKAEAYYRAKAKEDQSKQDL